MDTMSGYQNRPVIDMRPARFFQQLTTEQLIEHIQFASEIIADDIATGHRSMIEYMDGVPPMTVKAYVKALRFQLARREYQGVK